MVTSRLATGAAISTSDDVVALIAAGVTHVIDLRAEFDDGPLLAGSGLVYLYNPAADDGQVKPAAWWQASLAFASQALTTLGTCVYGHCAAGVNRGPSTAYAILRACHGLGPAAARNLVLAARPQAQMAYAGGFDAWWATANPGKAAGP